LKNAEQIHGVVSATFPSFKASLLPKDCSDSSNSVDELACSWTNIIKHLTKVKDSEDLPHDELLVSISNVRSWEYSTCRDTN